MHTGIGRACGGRVWFANAAPVLTKPAATANPRIAGRQRKAALASTRMNSPCPASQRLHRRGVELFAGYKNKLRRIASAGQGDLEIFL
jgi:hypothetical protein